ncbi:unnamed protein product [Rotaria socialis]|uniref:Ubiquitin carboxyl-terminal hydrolase 7 n=1 Tax=Rotaria socialis TaxID=392032 RepID=A0A820U6T1_9BILA|nr:unnamed protein product [Rotaria socialis]CAF4481999.1 unnamed protein product [Rotaria socialis]
MSGIKRNYLAEECSATPNDNNSSLTDNNIQSSSPSDSPQSKKLRHSSSHHTTESENDDDTQEDQYEQENGINNGHSPVQFERSEEEEDDEDEDEDDDDDEAAEAEPECFSDDSIVHVSFDNGKDDIFRYDGSIRFHIIAPSRPQSGQITSDQSVIRTFIWTLLAFSKPNYDTCHNDGGTFSLFLKCEPDKISPGWSIFAKAELTLLHATDPNKNFVKKINHLFNARSVDWGFHQFKSLKEIYSEYIHWPDNTIQIEAKIHADAPRNVDWDSKGQTGFVGLRNIGATCYMNSFLQTIYFTKKLRRAVYALPTDSDDQLHSIPLALQKLFYDLQFTDRPLLDKLESKMEGTTMEGVIPSLFQGQYVQYVRCTKVDHESRVKQTFYDVPLQVRNNANITESFRDFCKSEILTGENLYDAGSIHGLQEAEKGVKFQKFPPVLCLHLLRFEYDYNLSQHRKINDSYSFDYHLDLSEFLENPDCSSCSYKLLSILVHSGDNSSGHYVSFINPALDEQWFKFDDDVVARVAASDAMERNFGGTQDDDGSMYNTSAYMLVYIREDCQNDALCDINQEDIPQNLIARFDYDKKYLLKRRQDMIDNDGFVDIQIILTDDFHIQQTICLTDLIYENPVELLPNKRCLRFVQAQHGEIFRVFARRLAYALGVNLDEDIRIWIVHTHEIHVNHHYHSQSLLTSALVYCDDYDKKIIDLFEYDISDRRTLSIFVEHKIFLNSIYQLLAFDKDDDLLIFVRLYNFRCESLLYHGHFLFSQQQSFQKCLTDIALQIKIPITTSTTFIVHQAVPTHNQTHQYELIKASSYDLSLNQVLDPCLSGVSIIIQIIDINQTNDDYPLTTVEDYFRNIGNRQEFDVCNRDSLRNECLFKLYLPIKTSVKEVIRLISERIEYSHQQIILQKPSTSTSISNNISSTNSLHVSSDQTLRDLYSNTRGSVSSPRKLYFRRLPFNYMELENRRPLRLFFTNPAKKDEQREVQLYVKKTSTVAEFIDEVKQWIPSVCSENGSQKLRLIEVTLSSQLNSLPFHLHIWSNRSCMDELENCSNRYYHLEEISNDEIDLEKDSELIPVAHYTKENMIQINIQKFFPFLLKVIHNESFGDVKQRLQTKMGLVNREFEKYRFSIFNGSKVISRCDDNMGKINVNELKLVQSICWLGLELPSISNPRKTRKSLFSEKPIRIN